MNDTYDTTCTPCDTVSEERIAYIVRENSGKINSIFADVCKMAEFIYGKGKERDIVKEEPKCMRDEVFWQRSMIDRTAEEILALESKLGIM